MFSLIKFFKIMAIVFPILVLISFVIAKIVGLQTEVNGESIVYFLVGEVVFIAMPKLLELIRY